MKKFIAVCAVLLFVAPAFAADWAFYGSQRVHTYYMYNDYGSQAVAARPTNNGVASAPGDNNDWGMQWAFQPGSRFGAKVKADKVSGQIEMGLNMNNANSGSAGGTASSSSTNGTSGGDGFVSMRRAYGVWKFADNMSLKVGKDYTPVSNLTSGTVFDDDGNFLGVGDFYGARPGQLALELGAFEIAFITNKVNGGAITTANIDPDNNVPKVEARYTLKMDKFQIIPYGGVQYFKISEGTSTLTDDLDIISYVVGGVVKADIGAFYIIGQAAYGQNWSNAGWASGTNGFGANAASASLDGTDDVNDAESWLVGLIAGLRFTDTLKFEAGVGYRVDDTGINGYDDAVGWKAYGQVVWTLAPGVYLVPEVGYIDYGQTVTGDADNYGYTWYAGAKWQIDF